jgi:nicotinamidase-related amidase
MLRVELPIPAHFSPESTNKVYRVPYQERATQATEWARRHGLKPAAGDRLRIALLAVDIQNTFCMPGFELFVGGRSGTGAVDDSRRLCEFIYRNLDVITQIIPTMDTHQAMQIFHALYLVNDRGEHPSPFTQVSAEDIERGRWRFNTEVARSLNIDEAEGQRYLLHYTRTLQKTGKYELSIWPYHSMLGGIGHALVPAVEEAIFFHTIARYSQADFRIKGHNPATEHYSVLGPEVTLDARGREIASKDRELIDRLWTFDAVIIAGQAKSHCVAWTVEDLLSTALHRDPQLARKIYLLEDCSSAVVVPGVIDYTDQADAAYKRFVEAGMHLVRSTDSIGGWPGLEGFQIKSS